MPVLLLVWIWLAAGIFVVACLRRWVRYARAPVHLRWDLYPVAHEPGSHGGSCLEQRDWWTKPRVRNRRARTAFVFREVFWLAGLRAHNRKLWRASLPFHWGLYLLVATSAGLGVATIGIARRWWLDCLAATGATGGLLTAAGALALLVLRSRDSGLSLYTTLLDRLNLALLAILGGLSAAVLLLPPGPPQVIRALEVIARLQPPEVSPLLGAQMTVAALFLIYLPFTRMVHFLTKYFAYHAVRWDDRPVGQGDALDRRLRDALDFGVTWSAGHIGTGMSWAEAATEPPETEDDPEREHVA